MTHELAPIDITGTPELLQLAEEVKATGKPRRLRRNHEDVAVLSPVPSAHRPRRGTRSTSADDPLWSIIGMAETAGPGDVAANVDRYLADAHGRQEP